MKKIFITGANGYIGRQMVYFFLKNGFFVRALVRNKNKCDLYFDPNLEIFEGDLNNKKLLISAMTGVDYAIHLAGRKNDENDSYKVNVLGSKNVVESAEVARVKRLIYFSSASVTITKKGMYAETKLLGEEYFLKSRVKNFVFRLNIVYSENMGGIFKTLTKWIERLSILPVFGNGKNIFNPVHVTDLNNLVMIALNTTKAKEKIYNIGGIDGISFDDFIYLIARSLGKKIIILHLPVWFGIILVRVANIFNLNIGITESNILGASQPTVFDLKNTISDFNFHPRRIKTGLDIIFKKNSLIKDEAEIIFNHILRFSGSHIQDIDYYANKYRQALKINNIPQYKKNSWLFNKKYILDGADFLAVFYRESVLAKKLLLAAAIIESSPISANWLLPKTRSSMELVKIGAILLLGLIIKFVVGIFIIVQPKFYNKYLS